MFTTFAPGDGPRAYTWLTHLVTPRPIAWVSTLDAHKRPNLAPFSFFNVMGAEPPTLVFATSLTRDAEPKDTLRNVQLVAQCVVHLVDRAHAEVMNRTAARLPWGKSEWAHAGLQPVASSVVAPPRLASAPAAFECSVRQVVPLGDRPLSSTLVICTVLALHVRDDVLGADGLPDPAKLDLIARLGGEGYTHPPASARFTLSRPG